MAACTPCPAGTFSSAIMATTSSVCENCPVGTANRLTGQTSILSCITCKAGEVSSAGSAVCTACGAGNYSPYGVNLCLSCQPGTFSASSIAQATCTTAPAGSYAPFYGMISAFDCPPGMFSHSGALICNSCPAGLELGIPVRMETVLEAVCHVLVEPTVIWRG